MMLWPLQARNMLTEVWLFFLLGLQGAATINLRMESLNNLLVAALSD